MNTVWFRLLMYSHVTCLYNKCSKTLYVFITYLHQNTTTIQEHCSTLWVKLLFSSLSNSSRTVFLSPLGSYHVHGMSEVTACDVMCWFQSLGMSEVTACDVMCWFQSLGMSEVTACDVMCWFQSLGVSEVTACDVLCWFQSLGMSEVTACDVMFWCEWGENKKVLNVIKQRNIHPSNVTVTSIGQTDVYWFICNVNCFM